MKKTENRKPKEKETRQKAEDKNLCLLDILRICNSSSKTTLPLPSILLLFNLLAFQNCNPDQEINHYLQLLV